ncbi:hypothetical protein [uncultured Gammaproteobacteria bacterium]|nr:hypothetical protein [uncultured Gammaproteobacteria bacterium]CAC9994866.1 hypothetical protein [uncultured Gammaproteobacteria bacterium]
MNYRTEYGLSNDDITFIDKKIQEANVIFERISKKESYIKENCESEAIREYLDNL